MTAENKKQEESVRKIRIHVQSAQEVTFAGEADFIQAPGREGVLGITPEHTKMVSLLREGDIVVTDEGKEKRIPVTEGLLQVNRDCVDILISK